MRGLAMALLVSVPFAFFSGSSEAAPENCVPGQESFYVNVQMNSRFPQTQGQTDVMALKSQMESKIGTIKSIAVAAGVSSKPIANYSVHMSNAMRNTSLLSSLSGAMDAPAGSGGPGDDKSGELRGSYFGELRFPVTSDDQGFQLVGAFAKKGYPSSYVHQTAKCN